MLVRNKGSEPPLLQNHVSCFGVLCHCLLQKALPDHPQPFRQPAWVPSGLSCCILDIDIDIGAPPASESLGTGKSVGGGGGEAWRLPHFRTEHNGADSSGCSAPGRLLLPRPPNLPIPDFYSPPPPSSFLMLQLLLQGTVSMRENVFTHHTDLKHTT